MGSPDIVFDERKQASVTEPESVSEGEVVIGDHGADSELKRTLSTRHLVMVSLGFVHATRVLRKSFVINL